MKKTIFILMIVSIIFLGIPPSMAGDFSLGIRGGIYAPMKDGLQQGKWLEARIKYKGLYLWGSHGTTERRIAGQRAGEIGLWGGGFGVEKEIIKGITAWGQAGYYYPRHKDMNGHAGDAEPLWLYWKNWGREHDLDVSTFQHFEHKISGSPGGAIGINLRQEIVSGLSVGFDIGYQFLKLREQFWARNIASYLETREHMNFSGPLLGISIQYLF